MLLGTFKVSLPVKGGNGCDVAYDLMILDVCIVDEVSMTFSSKIKNRKVCCERWMFTQGNNLSRHAQLTKIHHLYDLLLFGHTIVATDLQQT